MLTRAPCERDDRDDIAVVNDWWGDRNIAPMLPRLFFLHFRDTTYVIEDDGLILAFLIGFVSQSNPGEAYIHFVGVHPQYRRRGLATQLYETFFTEVHRRGCRFVRAITSPMNQGSIAFHTRMEFRMEQGDANVDGLPVVRNFNGSGGDRVLLVRAL